MFDIARAALLSAGVREDELPRTQAFKSRTVLIFGTITDATAAEAARRLIALDSDSSGPIDVIVSSPGGHLDSGDIDIPVNGARPVLCPICGTPCLR
jgi:hypothetical protein